MSRDVTELNKTPEALCDEIVDAVGLALSDYSTDELVSALRVAAERSERSWLTTVLAEYLSVWREVYNTGTSDK